jgi:hypothetical protein
MGDFDSIDDFLGPNYSFLLAHTTFFVGRQGSVLFVIAMTDT